MMELKYNSKPKENDNDYGYGHIEKIFGVYTEKDAAEVAKDLVTKEL